MTSFFPSKIILECQRHQHFARLDRGAKILEYRTTKAEEKEQIQRQMAEMLKEYNVAHAMARAAKTSEFQAKEKEKQLQRKNQVLHTTLKTRQNHYGRVGSTQTDKNMGDRYLYPNTHFSRRKKKVLKKNKKKEEGGGGSPVNGGGSSRSC